MKFIQLLQASSQRYAIKRTRNILINMSDKQLLDIGYSRHLLEQGPSAWPWRIEGAVETKAPDNISVLNVTAADAAVELADDSMKESVAA